MTYIQPKHKHKQKQQSSGKSSQDRKEAEYRDRSVRMFADEDDSGDGVERLLRLAQRLSDRNVKSQALVDIAPDIIYRVDTEGNITELNKSFERITGWNREEWIGKPFPELTHPDDVAKGLAELARGLRGSPTGPYELRLRTKSGRYLVGEFRSVPEKAQGTITGKIGVVRDITRRRENENRIEILAKSGELLASPFFRDEEGALHNQEEVLKNMATLIVPKFSDWCAFDLVEEEELRRIVVAHRFPEKLQVLGQINQEYPTSRADSAMYRVFREKKPLFVPEVSDTMLREVARDEKHYELLSQLTLISVLVLPLVAHDGSVLGVFTVATGKSSMRALDKQDIEFAEELARRCSLFLDNSRLYLQMQRAQEERAQFLRREQIARAQIEAVQKRLQVQYEVSKHVLESGSWEATVPKVLEIIGQSVGADTGALFLLNEERDKMYCETIWKSIFARVEQYEEVTRKREFGVGEGIPGSVWESGSSVWFSDISKEKKFDRLRIAAQEGLRGAIFIPIFGTKGLVGVLEFFSYEEKQFNNDMVRALTTSAYHLGEFIERMYTSTALQTAMEALGEKLRLEEAAKAEDEALLASIGEGVIATNQEGEITYINKQTEKMLGWKEEDIMGKRLFDTLVVLDEQKNVMPITQRMNYIIRIKKAKIARANRYYVRKDKSIFPVVATGSPVIIDGKIKGVIIVFRDITREKEVDRAKSEFVSLASHQLRTPLSAINWYTETLLSGRIAPVNEKEGKYLREVHHASQRMVKLVNALLNVSRLEMGTFPAEPVPLPICTVAESVKHELWPQIEQKQLKVSERYDRENSIVYMDPTLATILFQNILSNAVKYTPDKGRIHIKVEKKTMPGKGPSEFVVIQVRDTGYGIPKDRQKFIFTKFFRADNIKEQDADGTGLGLYIVKSIVELGRGRIWFTSQEEKGTTFYIQLPAYKV